MFYQPPVIHTTEVYSLNRLLYFVIFCNYELDVLPDTEFEDHNRKLSLQKLPRITKKIKKCVSRTAILF